MNQRNNLKENSVTGKTRSQPTETVDRHEIDEQDEKENLEESESTGNHQMNEPETTQRQRRRTKKPPI